MTAKAKVEKPQVWDGKKARYVDAHQGLCHDCGSKDFIALSGAGRLKLCFVCAKKAENRWNARAKS